MGFGQRWGGWGAHVKNLSFPDPFDQRIDLILRKSRVDLLQGFQLINARNWLNKLLDPYLLDHPETTMHVQPPSLAFLP